MIRGFDDSIHLDLGKKADQMGISVNSIVKDAVVQWLDKKIYIPHVHDLLIYSDKKSMSNFLKSLDRMTNNVEWFKSFIISPKHNTEKILSKLNWYNGTIRPYKPYGLNGLRYCRKVIQKIVKASEKKPLCCVDFMITDIVNDSMNQIMEFEKEYNNTRLSGMMFCPYNTSDLINLGITYMVELFLMHDRIFILKNDGIYRLHITKENIHKIFLN